MQFVRRAQTWLEQRVSTKQYDESVLKQSTQWAQSITWGLIATTGLSITWLTFAKTEEIVVAPGTLVPIGSVQEIQMPVGGIVDEILVKDGDRVMSGQTLIKLDTEATAQRLKSVEENLEYRQRQLELKNTELSEYKRLNQESIRTLQEKIVFEKKILDRYQRLANVGATAELQYLQQINTVKEVEAHLVKTQLDGLRQQAVLQQDVQRLKSEDINNIHRIAESK